MISTLLFSWLFIMVVGHFFLFWGGAEVGRVSFASRICPNYAGTKLILASHIYVYFVAGGEVCPGESIAALQERIPVPSKCLEVPASHKNAEILSDIFGRFYLVSQEK